MKSLVTALAVALALTAAPLWALAPIKQQQVQFAKGKNSASLKGRLHGDDVIDYKLRANAGQSMSVKFRPSNSAAYFNVLPPASEEALFIGSTSGNEFSGELPAAGEYRIRVYLMRSAARRHESTDYTLDVAITGGAPARAATGGGSDAERAADATRRASAGRFDATGLCPCAQHRGQPMATCEFGVARAGKASGTATVIVTRPDGRKRAIYFEKFKAVGADLSQADGNMEFRATQENDLYKIQAGDERYEIAEAALTGG